MKDTVEEIYTAVLERFAKIAVAPSEEEKFPVGLASAKALGYEPQELAGGYFAR